LINKLFNCARVRNEMIYRGEKLEKTWVVRYFWDTLYRNTNLMATFKKLAGH